MITVHHLNNSRSQRILWLLEELGIPYEVKRYERQANMMAPQALRAVHPLGKSPVITDGDLTIAETGAIVQYLIETYGNGRLIPAAGTPEYHRYTYWLHYAEGSAMMVLMLKLIVTDGPEAKRVPSLLRPVARAIAGRLDKSFADPQIAPHIALWNAELTKSKFFAGDELTGADIMMSFPLEAASSRASLPPAVVAYLGTIHDRPAYQAALKRGGPYTMDVGLGR